MAQAYNSGGVYSSQLIGVPESYSEEMGIMALREAPLLAILSPDMGTRNPVLSHVHKYNDMVWRPTVTTLNGTISDSDTSIVFSEAVFRPGEIVRIGMETILLGTSADNLTFASCTRSVGTPAGAAHASGSMCVGLGVPQVQGAAAATADVVVEPDEITNYVQCFAKYILVPDATAGLEQHFRPGTSRFEYERDQQMVTLLHELENAVLWGTAQAPSTNATAGKMCGIYERLHGVSVSDLSGSALSLDDLRSACRASGNYGGGPVLDLVANLYTCDVVDAWQIPHVQAPAGSPEANVWGVRVSRVRVGGRDINVIPYPKADDVVFLLDRSKIEVKELINSGWQLRLEGRDGLRNKWDLSGYFTCEVKCPRAHYVFTSVKSS